MVRVWYASDLHFMSGSDWLEGLPFSSKPESDDWLVLAGDVGSDIPFVAEVLGTLSNLFSHVFFVFGNHEYYNTYKMYSSYEEAEQHLASCLSEERHNNIHILNNKSIVIDGIHVVGSSNWYNLPDNYSKAWWSSMNNDSRYVHPEGYASSNKHSEKDEAFLSSIKEDIDLLITHVPPIHLPNNTFEENYSFFKPVDLGVSVGVWVAGHQHFTYEGYIDDSTLLLVNPKGYQEENIPFIMKSFELAKGQKVSLPEYYIRYYKNGLANTFNEQPVFESSSASAICDYLFLKAGYRPSISSITGLDSNTNKVICSKGDYWAVGRRNLNV